MINYPRSAILLGRGLGTQAAGRKVHEVIRAIIWLSPLCFCGPGCGPTCVSGAATALRCGRMCVFFAVPTHTRPRLEPSRVELRKHPLQRHQVKWKAKIERPRIGSWKCGEVGCSMLYYSHERTAVFYCFHYSCVRGSRVVVIGYAIQHWLWI